MTLKGPRGVGLLQGELLTLEAAGAHTVGANGAAVYVAGERKRYIVVNAITASATDAGDVCDVFVDFSIDGVTYYNAIHFTQQAGNGAARTEFATLDTANPGALTIDVTADAASGVTRPALFGAYIRARWEVTDAGGPADQSHTFSVIAYAL